MYGLGRGQPTNRAGIPRGAGHPVDAVVRTDFVSRGWLAGANPELLTSSASGTCAETCSGGADATASSAAATSPMFPVRRMSRLLPSDDQHNIHARGRRRFV